jgi:hypothetical protein
MKILQKTIEVRVTYDQEQWDADLAAVQSQIKEFREHENFGQVLTITVAMHDPDAVSQVRVLPRREE